MANRRFIDFPVATTVGANDIILIWQDGLNKQTTKATILSGLPEDLEDLADVNISGLTNGQILRYDSTTGKWENTDQGNLDLNDLNDVSIVSPSNGQVLVYNSSTSKWENSSGGFVPYVGAVTTVDLGAQGLRAGYVRFNTSVVSVPDEQGLMYWDADDETVAVILNGTIMKIGEDQFYPVKNQTGSTIAKGTAVRFAGTVGASGRLLIAPFIADNSVPSSRFMGVTSEAILNGADGKVMWFGRIRGINTNAFNEGDILYASTTTAGGFQTAIPVAPNNIVQVAAVVTKSTNNGTIFVRPTLGSNINKDEGVKIVSPTTGQLLQLQSNGLWENKTKAQVLGGTSSQFVKGDGSLDSTAYVPTSREVIAGAGLTGGGALTGNVTLSHADTSSQASVDNSNGNVIQDVTLDTYGHITALASTNLDNRYYTEAEIDSTLTNYQLRSEKAQPNGYASLDSNGKVPLVQINDALIGNVNFQGLWNAATNTPTLANPPASGTKGYYYIVSTAGTFAGISFEVGDWIISNGTAWGKVDNTDAVSSVFGRTGNVTATNGDYNTSQVTENTNLYYTEARVNANTNVAANTAARHNAVTLGTANGLSLSTQVLSLQLATSGQNGALSSSDWTTFNNKENAITAGTTAQYFRGDKTFQTLNTGVVPESGNLYFTNARAIASVLTGYTSGAGTISAADSILSAIQKLNGNIGALVTGVSSVNGQTGVVVLTTTNIAEGTNLYYTEARVNANTNVAANTAARHAAVTLGTANGLSLNVQQLSLGLASAGVTGALSGTDWSTFNSKQNALNGTGFVKIIGTTISYDNSTYLTTAAAASTYLPLAGGTMTGQIVLTTGTGGGIRFPNDPFGGGSDTAGMRLISRGGEAMSLEIYTTNDADDWVNISVPSNDSAKVNGNTIWNAGNITPVPTSRTITINGTTQDLSANRTFNVGTVTSVAALTLGTSGTDLSSSVANGTTTPVITLNVPTASAANRGALSAADWTTFNSKENAITAGTTAQYYRGDKTFQTLNTAAVPELTNLYYTEARVSANTNVAANTAARHNAVTLGTANGLSLSTQQLSLGLASSSANGALSSTDWTTFNNKQNALTNPVTGTGSAGQVAYWSSGSAITGESNLFWDATNDRLGIGTATPATRLSVSGDITLQLLGAAIRDVGNSAILSVQNTNEIWLGGGGVGYFTRFYAGGTEKMRLDASGNLGLGVTPSAWNSAYKAFQFGTTGALFGESGDAANYFTTNTFVDSVGFKYITSDWALGYFQENGVHSWRTAPSGTAGNAISFTQAMTLGSNSGLSIGTPSAAPSQGLLVQGATTLTGALNGTSATLSANSTTVLINSATRAIDITGKNNFYAISVTGGSGTGTSYGSLISAGTNSSDVSFSVFNKAETINYFQVRGDGNVGIGTDTPDNPLTISSNTISQVSVNAISGNTNAQINLQPSGTGIALIGPFNAVALAFRTDATQRLAIFSNGNVTIANSPTDAGFKLDVNGTGRFSGALTANLLTSGSNVALPSNYELSYGNGNVSILGNTTTNTLEFRTSNATKVTIASTGAATFSSSVTAGGTITASLNQGSNNQFFNLTGTQSGFAQTYSLGIVGSSKDLRIFDITANAERIRLSSVGDFTVNGAILTTGIYTSSTSEFATTVGQVRIGTTTPSSDKLRVAGSTYTDTIITQTPAATTKSVAWKLGTAATGTVNPNRLIRVEVDGVGYDLVARQII
jgi:hypothetical protein